MPLSILKEIFIDKIVYEDSDFVLKFCQNKKNGCYCVATGAGPRQVIDIAKKMV